MVSEQHSRIVLTVLCALFLSAVYSPGAQPERPIDRAPTGDRLQRLIDQGALNLPKGVTIERIPNDVRDLGVVYNDAHRSVGNVAAVSATEAIVHRNDFDSGFAVFMNFQPTTGAAFPGAFLSDNLALGNGFKSNDLISSYELKIFRSPRDPSSNVLADVHVELWDGDPLALVDTANQGFANAPIPGSDVTFSGIPANTVATLRAVLDLPATAPNRRVWLTMTASSCRLGWKISGIRPSVSFRHVVDVYEIQTDADGSFNGDGNCCDTGEPCNVSEGVFCADDTDGSAQMCSDGDAEAATLSFFGGPCTGDNTTDNCATFFSTVRAPAKTTISLVPVGNGPMGALDPGARINGNEITLSQGGDTDVILEIRVSNFDPDGLGVATNGYQAVLDVSSYTSGLAGTLAAAFGRHACASSADCVSFVGGVCNLLGNPCSSSADCLSFESCTSQVDCSEWCGQFGVSGCGTTFCAPVFVATNREDFLLAQSGTSVLSGIRFFSPRLTLLAAVTGGLPVSARNPYPVEGLYGGSLVFYVPADARGTFTVALEDPPNTQVIDEATANGIPLQGLVPAKITIPTDRCCFSIGPDTQCNDVFDAAECAAAPGPSLLIPGGLCGDPAGGCFEDCNGNGTPDPEDIVTNQSSDCNNNSIPDDCEADLDGDGVIDVCDACPQEPINDEDGDGVCYPWDVCRTDPQKTVPGACGCGRSEVDIDGDTVPRCIDLCVGIDDRIDEDGNGISDCVEDGTIPTLSTWSMLILTLLLLTVGKLLFDPRRRRVFFA